MKEDAQLQPTDGGLTEYGPDSISAAETARVHLRDGNPQHDSRGEFKNNEGETECGSSDAVEGMTLMESNSGSADPLHRANGVAKIQ